TPLVADLRPSRGHIAVARTLRQRLTWPPDGLVVDQLVVTRRPGIAHPGRGHALVGRRGGGGAERDTHLRISRCERRRDDRRRREECGGGKGRDRHTLQHDLPPSARSSQGTCAHAW